MELLKSNEAFRKTAAELEESNANLQAETKHTKDKYRNLKSELMISKSHSADM
jgi:hypothetical protein